MCKTWKIWHAHVLVHALLVCTQLPVNTCKTQVMHIMSSDLVCHTTHVVYRYSRYIRIDNEMHWFCGWAASNSVSPLTKYVGLSLLINMWRYMYYVETRVRLNSYVATCSLNNTSYFISWTIVEVDLRQKRSILMSITGPVEMVRSGYGWTNFSKGKI